MQWRRILKLSIASLWHARPRTLLSVLAMAIGIAAVLVLSSLGVGAERAFQESLELFGRNLLVINAGSTDTDALRGGSRRLDTLTLDDGRAIVDQIDGVERTAPIVTGARLLRSGRDTLMATVLGSTEDLRKARSYELVAGRFIDSWDVEQAQRVAVVGAAIVENLYLGESPLGRSLNVAAVPFTIIGVLEEKGSSPDGANQDDLILIPISTARRTAPRRTLGTDAVERIYAQIVERSLLPATSEEIRALLRQRHGLGPGDADDFAIRDQQALLEAQHSSDRSFDRLVSGLAFLTLGLSAIGLLAVSLLSVRARFGEIGLRMAVGARRRDILLQFLTEAILVAVVGGSAGLSLAVGGILLAERLTGWPLALSAQAVVLPFLISLVIAIAFGACPALYAARLDPIEALRST